LHARQFVEHRIGADRCFGFGQDFQDLAAQGCDLHAALTADRVDTPQPELLRLARSLMLRGHVLHAADRA